MCWLLASFGVVSRFLIFWFSLVYDRSRIERKEPLTNRCWYGYIWRRKWNESWVVSRTKITSAANVPQRKRHSNIFGRQGWYKWRWLAFKTPTHFVLYPLILEFGSNEYIFHGSAPFVGNDRWIFKYFATVAVVVWLNTSFAWVFVSDETLLDGTV